MSDIWSHLNYFVNKNFGSMVFYVSALRHDSIGFDIYTFIISHGQQNVITLFKVRGQGNGANALKSPYLTRYGF